jgi:NADH:ubiquinone oxidoreductase subunit 5 (subunit L)/multisubunit Na+/H+ antiporter MnhA subunit
MIGLIRAFADNSDMDERKKLRRIKHLFKKKIKDIFQDRRIAGIVSGLMLIGLPLFLGYESKSPVFFGMYSTKLMLVNAVYILLFLSSSALFIHLTSKNSKQ